jgi:hypothetical protein
MERLLIEDDAPQVQDLESFSTCSPASVKTGDR